MAISLGYTVDPNEVIQTGDGPRNVLLKLPYILDCDGTREWYQECYESAGWTGLEWIARGDIDDPALLVGTPPKEKVHKKD